MENSKTFSLPFFLFFFNNIFFLVNARKIEIQCHWTFLQNSTKLFCSKTLHYHHLFLFSTWKSFEQCLKIVVLCMLSGKLKYHIGKDRNIDPLQLSLFLFFNITELQWTMISTEVVLKVSLFIFTTSVNNFFRNFLFHLRSFFLLLPSTMTSNELIIIKLCIWYFLCNACITCNF